MPVQRGETRESSLFRAEGVRARFASWTLRGVAETLGIGCGDDELPQVRAAATSASRTVDVVASDDVASEGDALVRSHLSLQSLSSSTRSLSGQNQRHQAMQVTSRLSVLTGELRIESYFPADEATGEWLRKSAAASAN